MYEPDYRNDEPAEEEEAEPEDMDTVGARKRGG